MKTRSFSSLVVALVVVGGLLGTAVLLAGCDEKQQSKTSKPAPKPKGSAPAGVAVVNATCPMMGNKLDQANVPAGLTREFQGKKVGFCCGGCPVAWDKLTDARKSDKLAAAMAPAPE